MRISNPYVNILWIHIAGISVTNYRGSLLKKGVEAQEHCPRCNRIVILQARPKYVIFKEPADSPTCYSVRKESCETKELSPPIFAARTLEEVRAKLPPGMVNLGRFGVEPRELVERWV